MLTYVLGLAAISATPSASASAAPLGRIDVGGYVPATCRARDYNPPAGSDSRSQTCTGGASVAVSEEKLAGDAKLVRIVISPR
jgi:hypothetical protein